MRRINKSVAKGRNRQNEQKQEKALKAKFWDGLGSSNLMFSTLSEWYDAKHRQSPSDEVEFVNSIRIDDKELFKDYLFVSHLVHLLPKTKDERIDITDKIKLEYANLKETYHGAIKLEEGLGAFVAGKAAQPTPKEKKINSLDKIIEKVNTDYQGEFGDMDKVALENVYKMMMDAPVVKEKLKGYAKSNDPTMFIKSIFPDEFQRVLISCFMKNDEAYKRLLNNAQFQKTVMDIMAKELYKALVNRNDENK